VARAGSRYVCQTCGEAFLRWEGQCRACSSWNSLVETVVHLPSRADKARAARPAGVISTGVSLADVGAPDVERIAVGIGELDRVLGGGIVPGSLILLGGEPGVGKSTLLLQAAAGVATGTVPSRSVLYVSGEESAAQVRLRAVRLGIVDGAAGSAITVLAEGEVGRITEVARAARPALLIVDSIQTATVSELDGPAGSVGQVRESALRLMELAKGEGIAVMLVGHVTKDGSIAGPKTLEHLVDAVLELGGERSGILRVLRAAKNRFGSTEEIGVFELGEGGLAEVEDPARAFLVEHAGPAPGSVVAATMEGSRPLLVEVQALVAPAGYGTPARRASGVDANRLALIIAVLGRRAGVGLGTHDVFANLAGGLAVAEPGLDLPLALALASSLRDRPVLPGLVAVGEVGLLGELRGIPGVERRLREAARLGFTRAIVPAATRGGAPSVPGLAIHAVGTVRQAIEIALDDRAGPSGGPGRPLRRPAAPPRVAEAPRPMLG
jgi:DNA repair protein RadA/Sms